ncbi:MAG: tRNA pseudouridine(55) synthase TruB [Gemmatimonadales bacterium]
MSDRSAVVLVDKPAGPTSHDVVGTARRALRTRRIGHTGTLDPFATGLLILCVGRATRLVEYFHLLPKTYEADVVFGEARDTDDLTGAVTERAELDPSLDAARIREALEESRGRSEQRPPDYSAIRRDGERAYEAARRGEPLPLEPRPIEVHEARLESWDPPVARIVYSVSTGTYVRALARDLGARLGCPAHLGALRRTRIGPFAVRAAVAPDGVSWEGAGTLSPLAALRWLPTRELSAEERTAIGYGQALEGTAAAAPDEPQPGLVADELPVALRADGRLVAIARRRDGETRPEKVFDAA